MKVILVADTKADTKADINSMAFLDHILGLFLKECEWLFNNPDPFNQLMMLKQWVKENMNQLQDSF